MYVKGTTREEINCILCLFLRGPRRRRLPQRQAIHTRFPRRVGLMVPHGDRDEADNPSVAHAMIFIIMFSNALYSSHT